MELSEVASSWCHVINLTGYPTRLARTVKNLNARGIKACRFEAIDGRDGGAVTAALTTLGMEFRPTRHTLTPGQKGCALSHLLLWQR